LEVSASKEKFMSKTRKELKMETAIMPGEMVIIDTNETALVRWPQEQTRHIDRYRRLDIDEFIYGSGQVIFDLPTSEE
jgi:hypothetical protein